MTANKSVYDNNDNNNLDTSILCPALIPDIIKHISDRWSITEIWGSGLETR